MATETSTEGTPGAAANADAGGEGQSAAGGGSAGEGQGAEGTPGNPEGGEGAASGAGGGEGAADGGAGSGDGAGAGEGGEDEGGPETTYEFKVPEGITISEAWGGKLTEFAKGAKLTPEQAQSVVDMGVEFQNEILSQINAAVTERTGQWAAQAKADPVVGGKDYEANVQVALNAVAKFGDPELTQLFEDYSLGNNPAMLRAFYKIGKLVSESGGVDGLGAESRAAPANSEAAQAARMYEAAGKRRGRAPQT